MSSNLFIPSALAAGLVLSADQLDLADTIGFIDNKDVIATEPADGDAILDLGGGEIDIESLDLIEIAADRKTTTQLRTRKAPKSRSKVGTQRTPRKPTRQLNTGRVTTGDRKIDAGKIDGANDIIRGRGCCTIEAN